MENSECVLNSHVGIQKLIINQFCTLELLQQTAVLESSYILDS